MEKFLSEAKVLDIISDLPLMYELKTKLLSPNDHHGDLVVSAEINDIELSDIDGEYVLQAIQYSDTNGTEEVFYLTANKFEEQFGLDNWIKYDRRKK